MQHSPCTSYYLHPLLSRTLGKPPATALRIRSIFEKKILLIEFLQCFRYSSINWETPFDGKEVIRSWRGWLRHDSALMRCNRNVFLTGNLGKTWDFKIRGPLNKSVFYRDPTQLYDTRSEKSKEQRGFSGEIDSIFLTSAYLNPDNENIVILNKNHYQKIVQKIQLKNDASDE